MFVLDKNEEVSKLIEITKSNSGVSGPELAKAHFRLGEIMASELGFDPSDTTVVAVLRGGLFFAEGLYFGLGCRFQIFDPKSEHFVRPGTKTVIVADSVVNTGKTLLPLLNQDIKVACCVINEGSVPIFYDVLYTVRISQNYFLGSNVKIQSGTKGPDTTMRLFNQL